MKRRLLISLATLWAGLLGGIAPAVAQQFEKVDEAARENLPATPFVAAAYGFIWIAILAYVAITARRIRRVESEMLNLRRRVDGLAGPGAAGDAATARR